MRAAHIGGTPMGATEMVAMPIFNRIAPGKRFPLPSGKNLA